MKTGVLYASMTGHSKKIANAIGKALAIPVMNQKDNPVIQGYDKLFVVSGIYGGKSKPELLAFATQLKPEMAKEVILVTSSMSNMKQEELRSVFKEAGISVAEKEYLCKGSFLIFGITHPNKNEIMGAVNFCQSHLGK